jgi:hypothetical protein
MCSFLAPPPPQVSTQIGPLMNNGARDVSNGDIQKLQQQLQDIKEQVNNHQFNRRNTVIEIKFNELLIYL